ncbi:hypothetical protein [Streptomyces sp. NPDC006645]|uniref:hypothetical protein n=1 Tax=unclassified Streptomyces TaxID=2593676 RepID=UPI0033BABEF2
MAESAAVDTPSTADAPDTRRAEPPTRRDDTTRASTQAAFRQAVFETSRLPRGAWHAPSAP